MAVSPEAFPAPIPLVTFLLCSASCHLPLLTYVAALVFVASQLECQVESAEALSDLRPRAQRVQDHGPGSSTV